VFRRNVPPASSRYKMEATSFSGWVVIKWRHIFTAVRLSALKMEAECSSESLVPTYKSTPRYPEYQHDVIVVLLDSQVTVTLMYKLSTDF
jgi:hypothetical protein